MGDKLYYNKPKKWKRRAAFLIWAPGTQGADGATGLSPMNFIGIGLFFFHRSSAYFIGERKDVCMNSEQRVVLEVEKLLAYLGLDYEKWQAFNHSSDLNSQTESLQVSETAHTVRNSGARFNVREL